MPKKKYIIGALIIFLAFGAAAFYMKPEAEEDLPEEGQETEIADGVDMGYISALYESGGVRYMDLDHAEWLTGEEAARVKIEDGECTITEEEDPSMCVPNGFYVRNTDSAIQTFEVAPDALVMRSTDFEYSDTGERQISYEALVALFSSEGSYFRSIPFHIEIKDGKVISIKEQYLP